MNVTISGKYTMLIDDDDLRWIQGKNIHVNSKGYAEVRWGGRKSPTSRLVHRMIMGEPNGIHIDHINGNPLDNRKSNLRLATRSQNMINSRVYESNTSGQRGVTRHGSGWVARIQLQGKRKHLGYFQSFEEACSAYKDASTLLHGSFARNRHQEKLIAQR
jgi:hypothetical protein